MIRVDEALRLVLEAARPLAAGSVPLDNAAGLVLAEDVTSDIDSPPYDKSVVDGYAVQAASVTEGAELPILEEVVAGEVPSREVIAGTATRIMTGAPLPTGADAVVMVERTELLGSDHQPRVRILAPVKPGQSIMRRAASMHCGETVLRAPRLLTAIDVGLLAEVGRATLSAIPKPSVAVLATGNELVDPAITPGPGQIRNSNGPMLASLVREAGGKVAELGVARDNQRDLRAKIDEGLQHDVLILSGGVSEGVLDLAPRVLAQAGVEQVFHKVQMKPGKPLWFGRNRSEQRTTLVFGLPGNPVSSLVCFQLFVLPAVQRLAGRQATGLPRKRALLAKSHFQRGDRPTYWPAAWATETNESQVTPLAWQGSGDLRSLADADGLAYFPTGDRTYEIGDEIEMLYWR